MYNSILTNDNRNFNTCCVLDGLLYIIIVSETIFFLKGHLIEPSFLRGEVTDLSLVRYF